MPSFENKNHNPFAAERFEQSEYSLPTDSETIKGLYKLVQSGSVVGETAKIVWEALRKKRAEWEEEGRKPTQFDLPPALTKKIKSEDWNALQYELEEERILRGEITPRVQEFLDSREQLSRSLRAERENLQTESINAEDELMTEREKKDSRLFKEADEIVQNLAREYGFTRPVSVEIARSPVFNAYVLTAAKEGGFEKDNAVPLRVFINVGLITEAAKLMKARGKELTRAHLAFVIGHELAHLKQPGYEMDKPPTNREEHQRYEYDADASSLEVMDRAGYNPVEGIEMSDILKGGSGELLSHYVQQTHPITENRTKELWRMYQRPDRPFFSSQKEPEPLSADVFAEADDLLRVDLKKSLEAAVSIEDLNKIVERLERDPKATLKDAEIIGKELKKHLDVRAGISGALHAIETNSPLVRAFLYKVNATIAKAKKDSRTPEYPWNYREQGHDRMGYGRGSLREPELRDVMKKVLASKELIKTDYDPRQTREEDELKIEQYILEHAAGDQVLTDIVFHSIDELLDPESQTARDYWLSIQPHLSEVGSDDVMTAARQNVIGSLATTLCVGFNDHQVYYGDAVAVKQAFIEALQEIQTKPDLPDATSISFDRSLLERVSQRVAQRTASRPTDPPFAAVKTDNRHETYSLDCHLMNFPLRIPTETFYGQTAPTDDLSPLQHTIYRYVLATRQVLDRGLAPVTIQERFGRQVEDDLEAKNIIMDSLFRRVLFDDEPVSVDAMVPLFGEKQKVAQHVVDYARYVPSVRIQNYRQKNQDTSDWIKLLGAKVCGDERLLKTPQGAVQLLENARLFAQQPRLASFLSNAHFYEQKRTAFSALLQHSLDLSATESKAPLKAMLHSRAATSGLPIDFFLNLKLPTKNWDKVRRLLGATPAISDAERLTALNKIFSEEFMRLFADTEQEMEACNAETIQIKFERTV